MANNWTRNQTLVAFRLYCQTPYGGLNQSNADIPPLAAMIGRTPSAVIMKACNFAGLDPLHQARGVKGLSNRSQLETEIWSDFEADSEALANEMELAFETMGRQSVGGVVAAVVPGGETESLRTVKVRRVQRFFRSAVFNVYGGRCAVTGLGVPELLNASHIVPWAERESSRADPRNGICLNALHDRAFDRGLMTFGEKLEVVVSPKLVSTPNLLGDTAEVRTILLGQAGRQLRVPEAFGPSPEYLAFHRENVFGRGERRRQYDVRPKFGSSAGRIFALWPLCVRTDLAWACAISAIGSPPSRWQALLGDDGRAGVAAGKQ